MKVRLLQRWNGIVDGPHEVGAIVDMPDHIAEYMIPAGVCVAADATPPAEPPGDAGAGGALDPNTRTPDVTTDNVETETDVEVTDDMSTMTVAEALPLIEGSEDVDELSAWRDAEAGSKGRKSILAAIDVRLEALTAPTKPDATPPAEPPGDAGAGG